MKAFRGRGMCPAGRRRLCDTFFAADSELKLAGVAGSVKYGDMVESAGDGNMLASEGVATIEGLAV